MDKQAAYGADIGYTRSIIQQQRFADRISHISSLYTNIYMQNNIINLVLHTWALLAHVSVPTRQDPFRKNVEDQSLLSVIYSDSTSQRQQYIVLRRRRTKQIQNKRIYDIDRELQINLPKVNKNLLKLTFHYTYCTVSRLCFYF